MKKNTWATGPKSYPVLMLLIYLIAGVLLLKHYRY